LFFFYYDGFRLSGVGLPATGLFSLQILVDPSRFEYSWQWLLRSFVVAIFFNGQGYLHLLNLNGKINGHFRMTSDQKIHILKNLNRYVPIVQF
jgi:hypothetical protein